MTAQLLASELGNLIQESKRKHNDLRQASERSLDELKNLRDSSEARIGAELSHRPNFVNPFIIACGTRNVKFTSIAIVCLQRLIAAKGVPRSRLDQVLQAIRDASSVALDVQLRILQSLPSLLQNYATDVSGDLLVTALNICFVLQASKNVVVNNTASATLQQLLVSVFDKVAAEDKASPKPPPVGEAPAQDGAMVALPTAAMDAYRIFNDVCLLAEAGRPEYLRFSNLPQTFGLELIESVLTNHPAIFASHAEQLEILRARLMPFLVKSLLGRPNFATAVRLVRVLYTLLRRHMALLPAESGQGLAALAHVLDQETLVWKRVLCMEAFKGIFFEPALIRQIYMLYDAQQGEKKILQDLLATFVRVSTERPSVIGLGHQSTIPIAGSQVGSSAADQVVLEASGVSGIISGSVTSEGSSTGISSQWSSVRTPCIDQLDKAEPQTIPDSYIFALILSCITSLSEGLAKFILPLTVPGDGRSRKRTAKPEGQVVAAKEEAGAVGGSSSLERSASFKKNPVPVNPLALKDHPLQPEVKAYADMIEQCWPAILATCSTFLYAALDSEYYHSLVRAFQRFTHVAGLLQLTTPRDAFLTTLGKAAVPPNVLTACLNAGARPATPTSAGLDTPNSLFNNARGLLSVDSLVSQGSAAEKPRQPSADAGATSLNTRNLLCLRALLNLGIALGPTLQASWQIILETLQQADFVLFCSGKAPGRIATAVRAADAAAEAEANTLLSNFGAEIKAVETAASRLFESTVDFPNAAFVEFVVAICGLLEKRAEATAEGDDERQQQQPQGQRQRQPRPLLPKEPPKNSAAADSVSAGKGVSTLQTPVVKHKRVMSITTTPLAGPTQEDQFVLAKLGEVASINLERLLYHDPDVSGWTPLTSELSAALGSASTSASVRMRAAETLVRIVLEAMAAVSATKDNSGSSSGSGSSTAERGAIQLRLLQTLRASLVALQSTERRGSAVATQATDIDVHRVLLDGTKSLLEDSGESLVSGWDIVFDIIDSLFVDDGTAPVDENGLSDKVLTTRSVRLIKSSFSSLQLICSDFLPSLPNTCYLHLIDTLYKFCSQGDDLNVALTTVTFYWAISDFLLSRSSSMSITAAMEGGSGDAALVELAYNTSHPGSSAALWMLLLLRLTSVTTDQRLELRNSAIQTLLRIVHANGNSLTAEAWAVCIRSVIFKLLSSTELRLRATIDKGASAPTRSEWNETAVVIVNGVSELLASYLDVLASHAVFPSLWAELLGHFATMLDFEALEVSTAVFGSLGGVIAKNDHRSRSALGRQAIDLAWGLWSRGVPVRQPGPEPRTAAAEDNQKCLVSWVNALIEMERHMRVDMDLDRIRKMIRLLRDAIVWASPGSYSSDIEYVTPLQGRVLEVFKLVRTDVPGAPAALITQLAEFVSMAFDRPGCLLASPSSAPTQKRTFVAMAKATMPILHLHITQNTHDPDMFASGAFAAALAALAKPITLKYRFAIRTKSIQPWKEAVRAALAILEKTLPHVREQEVPTAAFQQVWDVIVSLANGIIRADMEQEDGQGGLTSSIVAEDQQFDMDAFHKLRELIIPRLGSSAVAEKTRRAYAEGLFRISIVHPPPPADAALIYATGTNTNTGLSNSNLGHLLQPGRGCTIDPPPTRRAEMSYVCLDELFSLVTADDDAEERPSIVVQPPTPRQPPRKMTLPAARPSSSSSDEESDAAKKSESERTWHMRLAKTAARYLILRCALTIRAYVSDQPLRGHMPQPLSQRQELYRILRCLVALRSEPGAIPDLDGVDGDGRKHLLRLYPLLTRAVQTAGTAGDDKTLALVGEALDAIGMELGV